MKFFFSELVFFLFLINILFYSTNVLAKDEKTAVLGGLDKVTARISTFVAPKDKYVKFKTLRILVRECFKRPPEETPETSVFLEIIDLRPGGKPLRVFTGWMFASSPALSALEHPTYDVWVIDCKISEPSKQLGNG
tara:strand:- start:647 stop:1054 length:408 start_codon:yes stop_codon:yes gene_type:complete